MSFEEMMCHFLDHLRLSKGASSHTLRAYQSDLSSFKNFLKEDELISLEQVVKRHIRRYLSMLFEEGLSVATTTRRLSSLRSLFQFALTRQWISFNPLEGIESPKKERKLPCSISYEEVLLLFEQPDLSSYLGVRDRAIMELLYSSGLRLSEIVGLNRRDLHIEERCFSVFGKGKKQRRAPVTKTAIDWIVSYLTLPERFLDGVIHQKQKDPEAIFLNRWGGRLSARSVDRNFSFYLKKSGLSERITPHTIRHTIATHWLERGMDLKTIQLLLGHNSLSTTTIYTHVSLKLKKEAYDKAHPRAKFSSPGD